MDGQLHRCSRCDSLKPLTSFPPSKARNKGQWCRQCLRDDKRHQLGLAASDRTATCDHCDTTFQTSFSKATYCSRACKDIAKNAERQALLNAAKPDRICAYCGTPLPKTKRADAKFCSAECNMQAHRQTRNFRRRAGTNAPLRPRKSPLINLADIAQRDGFRCGICGRKVDMSLKHPDPGFPSLDHVVPLANGGADIDPANLRLTHLRCNLSRRDGGGGEQLRFIG